MSETSFPKIGNLAPAFTLLDADGEKVSLKDFKGKKHVLVYFYPKAMTPGCTVQACGLRDAKKAYEKAGVAVLGVSPDPVSRLAKFAEKEGLNFTLLSDPEHELAEKYGVWALKKNYGREYWGILRTSFIIDNQGRLRHVIDKVKTKTHHDDVLNWIEENLNN